MAEKDFSPLSIQVVRGLNDKLYEKRKTAALEIERMVKEFQSNNDVKQIKKLITMLTDDFAVSHNPHSRKGGLIGLAATAIALGKDATFYLSSLVPPVLSCFSDQDSRVRYYGCEALYNIAKVARSSILPFFNEIFDGLSKLAADPDPNVKNGAELLDRLIKDIVTESSSFDLVSFIPLLRERIYTTNPHAKQFLVSWLSALDAVPELDLLVHLPEFLDGLFNIFRDKNGEIRKMCEFILGEFLKDIKKNHSTVNFAAMVNNLVHHSQSEDEVIQFTAITWLKEFVALSGRTMLPFCALILAAILPCVSYDQSKQHIREAAKAVNQGLMRLITTEDDIDSTKSINSSKAMGQLDLSRVVEVLTRQLSHKQIQTRLAVLRWVLQLHMKTPNRLFCHIESLFPALVKTLTDPSDEVVLLDLEVLADISASSAGSPRSRTNLSPELADTPTPQHHLLNTYFTKFMINLLKIFSTERQLLEERGPFIIRHLCLLLNAQNIYCALSEILQQEEDLEFASLMVNNLNMILLTSSELFELRQKLKDLENEDGCNLFTCLYRCWCHNPVATVSLCFLAQTYKHACDLLLKFGNLEVNAEFLTQIDKLVQMIESPIFTFLRLQLLDTDSNYFLLKALYGLLMLLPQSSAFTMLKNRLDCVPNTHMLPALKNQSNCASSSAEQRSAVRKVDFNDLLDHFIHIQHSHAVARKTKMGAKGKLLRDNNCASVSSHPIRSVCLEMTDAVLEVSDALLEKYPGFSSLCARISHMLDDRLVPKQLSEQLQRAKSSLAEARSQYLASHLVYSELRSVLASRQYGLKAEEEDSEDGDPVVSLLSEALSREEAKEYINLSVNPKAQNAENLFGLSKEDLDVEHRQKRNLHQTMQQNFTPLLEAKLRERSLELFRFWNPSSTDSDGLAIAKANQLPGVLSTQCARLASRKKELKDVSRKNDDLQQTYCRHLTNLLQQIEKIVEKYQVISESETAQSTARWLDAKCDFMLLKVKVMTEHLLAQTYNVDTVEALKKVRNHLEHEEQKSRLELSRAKEALRIYESVGITFKQLAEEYARLISEIDNKKWVLAELKKNVNDS